MSRDIPITIPKYHKGDRVRVYVDWIGYLKGTIVEMENTSIVHGWLYTVKLDERQETTREYVYNKCDLDIRKIKS